MKNPRVLVVEDESVIAMDIEEALTSLNYDVCGKAGSAAEAIKFAAELKPDVILMDIYLDGEMDGIEAAARISKERPVPIVFLTAYADKATLDRAKIVEPYGYVLKPFRQTELRTVIELALHRHSADLDRKSRAVDGATDDMRNVPVPDFLSIVTVRHEPSEAMQSTVLNFLEGISPLKELGPEMLRAIAAVSLVQAYPAHTTIIQEGAERDEGFIVMDGRLSVYKASAGGKELVVELLEPDDLFGFLAVLERARFPFSARSQTDLRVLWIPREVIFHITDNYCEISRELFHRVLERLRKAHNLSRALAHDKVDVRVATALYSICRDKAPEEVPELEMTRQELGELVGTTPETISRILNRLQDNGIVDLSVSGKVRVLNHEELVQLIRQ